MIYLLEDDDNIRGFVTYALNNSGFEASGFSHPSEFWSAIEKRKPELLLLDIMLPDEDGLTILKRLRKRSDTKDLPIIMLTAKTTEYDKVMGLDSGVYRLPMSDTSEINKRHIREALREHKLIN